jgi:hypothetical protein
MENTLEFVRDRRGFRHRVDIMALENGQHKRLGVRLWSTEGAPTTLVRIEVVGGWCGVEWLGLSCG